jgi:AcrR family transcriptional regulator
VKTPTAPAASTKGRLIEAAERLYAERGIEATSLRAVTAAAEANLAAVHYHFGSKEALTEAVFSRRIVPLNEERLAALTACQEAAGGQSPPLEEILEALMRPALERSGDPSQENFIRLMGRMYTEPGEGLQELLRRQFEDVLQRFGGALARALPELPPADLHWRLHFTIGAMIHTIADPVRLAEVSGGLCDLKVVETSVKQLVTYAAAGLRAPPISKRDAP